MKWYLIYKLRSRSYAIEIYSDISDLLDSFRLLDFTYNNEFMIIHGKEKLNMKRWKELIEDYE